MGYGRNETAKLTEAKHKNVKLYWKMLKTCAGVKQPYIQYDVRFVFQKYFESVNNPDDHFLGLMKMFCIL
jgi:hypothetical protein